MYEVLDNEYFNWLCTVVVGPIDYYKTPTTSHDIVLKTLHNTEFVWFLDGDDNRALDGKELRREFLLLGRIPDSMEWRTMFPSSVLEMLVAFSRRCEFNSDLSAKEWFWVMLDNLNLKDAVDSTGIEPIDVQEVLEHFMFRQYAPNGDGGLFPLDNPTQDQTRVEIWHQFCDYLVDKNLLPA